MPLLATTKLNYDDTKKLQELIDALPILIAELDNPAYDEIYGYRINTADKEWVDVRVRNEILYRFLSAAEMNVGKAYEQLIKTLNWRQEFRPLNAAFVEKYNEKTFENEHNIVSTLIAVFPEETRDESKYNRSVLIWNTCDNAEDRKILRKSSRKLSPQEYIRWRIGLIEKAMSKLDLTSKNNNKYTTIADCEHYDPFKDVQQNESNDLIGIVRDNYPLVFSDKIGVFASRSLRYASKAAKWGVFGKEMSTTKHYYSKKGDLTPWLPREKLPVRYGGIASSDSLLKLSESLEFHPRAYASVILKRGDAKVVEKEGDPSKASAPDTSLPSYDEAVRNSQV